MTFLSKFGILIHGESGSKKSTSCYHDGTKKRRPEVVSVSFDSLKRKTTTVTANGGHDGDGILLLWISYPEVRYEMLHCQARVFARFSGSQRNHACWFPTPGRLLV